MAALAAAPALAARAVPDAIPRSAWPKVGNAVGTSGGGKALPRYLHAAVGLPDGRMVVMGGYRVSAATRSRSVSAPTASVQLYDPSSNTWTDLAPMRIGRARHAAVLLADGRIAVLGGIYSTNMSSIEVYDPTANAWSSGGALPYPMVDLSATLSPSGIVVSGGQNGAPAFLVSLPPAHAGIQP